MKRNLWIPFAAALALCVSVAAGARASTDGLNPLELALQNGDVPATVHRTILGPAAPHLITQDALRFIGTGLKGADYSYTWPAGGTVAVPALGRTEKEWHLWGEVYVAPSVAAAKTLYRNGKAAKTGYFSDFPIKHLSRLSLPREGDEWFALLGPDGRGLQAMVFVRKGSVVWELRVGRSPDQWRASRSQIVAVLRMYAAKQKVRVGGG